MRLLRNIVIGLVGLVVVAAVVGYLLPREVTVHRSIVIDAPPEEVFPHLNSLRRGAAWSPWLGLDPDARLDYDGPEEGVGNTLVWSSDHPSVGSGRQVITRSEPHSRVESEVDFGEMGTAFAWFDLEPEGAETLVTWGLVADMGMNPVGRWMGLMMDRWVGADYERGLQNLRVLVEAS